MRKQKRRIFERKAHLFKPFLGKVVLWGGAQPTPTPSHPKAAFSGERIFPTIFQKHFQKRFPETLSEKCFPETFSGKVFRITFTRKCSGKRFQRNISRIEFWRKFSERCSETFPDDFACLFVCLLACLLACSLEWRERKLKFKTHQQKTSTKD